MAIYCIMKDIAFLEQAGIVKSNSIISTFLSGLDSQAMIFP